MRANARALFTILAIAVATSAVAVGVAEQTDTTTSALAAKPALSTQELQARVGAVFKNSCAVPGCHAGKHPELRLSLDPRLLPGSLKNVPSREMKTLKLVDTKEPARSYVLMKLRGDKGIKGKRMPRGGEPLPESQIALVSGWIDRLAADERGPAAPDGGR